MTSAEARRLLSTRLATYFAYRASSSDPSHKIICVNCGTVYERVKYQ